MQDVTIAALRQMFWSDDVRQNERYSSWAVFFAAVRDGAPASSFYLQ